MKKVRELFKKEGITRVVEKINIPEIALLGATNPYEPQDFTLDEYEGQEYLKDRHPDWLPRKTSLKSYLFKTDIFTFRLTEYKNLILYNVIMTAAAIKGHYDIRGAACAIRSASYPEIAFIDEAVIIYLEGAYNDRRWNTVKRRFPLAELCTKIKHTLEDNGIKYTIKSEKVDVEISVIRRNNES